MLSQEDIKILSSRSRRKCTVENFLCTIEYCGSKNNAIFNLKADAWTYKWDQDTFNAILDGIEKYYSDSNNDQ
jgi:hypothetical protein